MGNWRIIFFSPNVFFENSFSQSSIPRLAKIWKIFLEHASFSFCIILWWKFHPRCIQECSFIECCTNYWCATVANYCYDNDPNFLSPIILDGISRNFKVFIFKPKLSFLRENGKNGWIIGFLRIHPINFSRKYPLSKWPFSGN